MIFTIQNPKDRAVKTIWVKVNGLNKMCVGEISREIGEWQFHYGPLACHLKPQSTTAMLAFVNEQIALITIKEKLLA